MKTTVHDNPNLTGPSRKITPIYNYAARRWQFAIGKRTQNGVTQYRDADGTVFTSMDTDPTRHSINIETTLSPDDIAFFVALAKESPAECLSMASELPQDLKAQLQASFRNPKNFSPEEHTALKQAAAKRRNSTQPNEDGHRQAVGGVDEHAQDEVKQTISVAPSAFVVNLNKSPEWLLPHMQRHNGTQMIYIGRYNRRLSLEASQLANQHKMKGTSEAERNRVCDANIQDLIVALEVGKGPVYSLLDTMASEVRLGKPIALGCFCHPERCHGDAITLIVNSLAAGETVDSTIKKLRALLPVKQSVLLGV